EGGGDRVAAALAQAQGVIAAAALVRMAFQGDARGRTVTQVLGVTGHLRLELGAQGVLVEIEVDHPLAQARVGIQVFRSEHAGGRRGLGGGRRRGGLRRRCLLLHLPGTADKHQAQSSGKQDSVGGLHLVNPYWLNSMFRLMETLWRRRQRGSRKGPQAGPRTSPSASTRRWRRRRSDESAYSTPRRPSRAASGIRLAFGAKLGASSSEPGDSVDHRGVPRLRSSTAIRYTLPAPCATAILWP